MLALVILYRLLSTESLQMFKLPASTSTRVTFLLRRRSSNPTRTLKSSIWISTSWRKKLKRNTMSSFSPRVSCSCLIQHELSTSLRISWLQLERSTSWWHCSKIKEWSRSLQEKSSLIWSTLHRLISARSLMKMSSLSCWNRMDWISPTWRDWHPKRIYSWIHLDSSWLKPARSDGRENRKKRVIICIIFSCC